MTALSEGSLTRANVTAPRWSIRQEKRLAFGSGIVLTMALLGIFAPFISGHSPTALDVLHQLQGPTRGHWLGTDELGRDNFTRTLFAARVSLEVAGVSVGIGGVAGVLIGTAFAFYGGLWDAVGMRIIDVLYGFPAVLLAIAIEAGMGASNTATMVAIGVVFVPAFARLARTTALMVLRNTYVEAAHVLGMRGPMLLRREVLPNMLPEILVQASQSLAYAVLIEASLSFIGLGAQPPTPSWGNMLSEAQGFLSNAPWMTVGPGLALIVTILGFNLLGDGLRDWLDPRGHE